MEPFTISFFGHRRIENLVSIESKLISIVRDLLKSKAYVEFLVGRNGDFDQLVSLRRSEERKGNTEPTIARWCWFYPTSQRSAGTTKNPFWNIMMK